MRAFWTEGPVPYGLLDTLALPRPDALHAVLTDLATEGHAVLGGRPGSGRSTLAHQVAVARGDNALLVEGPALLAPGAAALEEQLADAVGLDPNRADTDRLRHRLQARGVGLLVLDGVDADPDWMAGLPEALGVSVLRIEEDRGIEPDPIDEPTAGAFLRAAGRRVGAEWTPVALEATVRFAGGQVDALQWLGACTLNAHRQAGSGRIDEDAALEGAVTASRHLPHRHAERLARVQGARRSLLKAVARFPDNTPTEWAQACQVPVPSAMVHLGRLVNEDHVLERVARGRYRFASALLGLHLQERYGSVTRSYVNPAPRGSSGTPPRP